MNVNCPTCKKPMYNIKNTDFHVCLADKQVRQYSVFSGKRAQVMIDWAKEEMGRNKP